MTSYVVLFTENLGPATESARIENQLNKVTPTAMLSSTIVASFQNPFTSSSYNHRCLSSVPTSTPGLTSTKNNRDSIIGNWTAIIIIIIGLYMYYSTGFLVVGLTILTAVSLITASLSFMVCKGLFKVNDIILYSIKILHPLIGCKRRAEKRQGMTVIHMAACVLLLTLHAQSTFTMCRHCRAEIWKLRRMWHMLLFSLKPNGMRHTQRPEGPT